MAMMCPEVPRSFHPASQEGVMFQALSQLPDSYYVFHSFSIVHVGEEGMNESETDFVIFHPDKGILCIEAKAGNVRYENGEWLYGSGIKMKKNGPFKQASGNMHNLMEYIDGCGYTHLRKKCKFLFAVWFPSLTRNAFDKVTLPPDADEQLILYRDSMSNIEQEIDRIFEIPLKGFDIQTMLGTNDVKILLDRILAPQFHIVSVSAMEQEHKRLVFKTLLKEQVALLNYLEEQNTAVINGMAGTGKTLMALEKAKRHAAVGESVLFLCYNKKLNQHLRDAYAYPNISYYTIDGLACKLCNTATPDYGALQERLEEYYLDGDFPYQHIIIDEGQDFGQDKIDEIAVIEMLQSIVTDHEEKHGTFYMFYDKNQLVQGKRIPAYIQNADCRLTLYRNCRNTENIAITSMRFLGTEKQPKLFEDAVIGETPSFYMETGDAKLKALHQCLTDMEQAGCRDIVILTCKTEQTSILTNLADAEHYRRNRRSYLFTSCRKFKGLEADGIIIVDLDKATMREHAEKLLYVGISRARFQLALIADLSEEECGELLDHMDMRRTKRPKKALAAVYNTKLASLPDEDPETT